MSQKKAKKIFEGILITFFSLILILSCLLFACYNFYIKPILNFEQSIHLSYSPIEPLKPVNLLTREVEKIRKERDFSEYRLIGFWAKPSELCDIYEDSIGKIIEYREEEILKAEEAQKKAEEEEKAKVAASGKKRRYEQVKDQVDPKDYSDALSIAGKVDAGYILGLLSGGLTVEEKRELKRYLNQRLSGAEISRGLSLYAKYSHLL